MRLLVIAPQGASEALLMSQCAEKLLIDPGLVADWKFSFPAKLANSKHALRSILDFHPDRIVAFRSNPEDLDQLSVLISVFPNASLTFVDIDGDEYIFESRKLDNDDDPILVYPTLQ